MKTSRFIILERAVFQIGFGLFAFLIWYFIEDIVTRFNQKVFSGHTYRPDDFLWLNFFYWLILLTAIGCLILGIAGIIRLLIRKD